MSRMSPFNVLHSFGLLTWNTIFAGWQRRWISKADVEAYATEQLAHHVTDVALPATAELAMAQCLDDQSIADELQRLAAEEKEHPETALTKWRLGKLVVLREEQLGWEETVDQLEALWAEFGFPPDMQNCSRYGTGNYDPLQAWDEVIVSLRRQLSVRPLADF